jgi:hypothetical protein
MVLAIGPAGHLMEARLRLYLIVAKVWEEQLDGNPERPTLFF